MKAELYDPMPIATPTTTPPVRFDSAARAEDAACEVEFLSLDEWQAQVEAHPAATAFHHRRWIELILQQYGGVCLIPAIRRGGQVATAFPLVETRSLTGRRKLSSLPFSDCVPVLSDADDLAADVHRCVEPLRSRGYRSIVIRSDRPLEGFSAASDAVRHVLDLARPAAEVEAAYDPGLRRNLRKAAAHGFRFQRRTDAAAMEAFFRLHVLTRRKLGVPVQPRRFFARLQESMIDGGLGFVGLAEKDGRPVAAAVYLHFHGVMIYKYGASDPQALEHRPNEFLMGQAIRAAIEDGCRGFDFGVTAKSNEGLRRFKRKWGAVESDAVHVYLAGQPRPRSEDSRLVNLAAGVIRRSPPAVCRLLGEALYRFSQ